jgi:outer membrane immunogenic protein
LPIPYFTILCGKSVTSKWKRSCYFNGLVRDAWEGLLKGLLFAAAAICFAWPAIAADLPSTAPPPVLATPQPYDWTGFYVGGHLGWGWGRGANTVTDAATGAFLGSSSGNGTNFHGGGQIGYDFMTPSGIVVGARAVLTFNPDRSSTASNATGAYVVSSSTTDNIVGSVNARLGYALGDFLPYAIGGWAWEADNATRTQNVGVSALATPGTAERENVFESGWDLGAGLEYRVWGAWTVFGEYYYQRYPKVSVTYPLAGLTSQGSSSANVVAFGVNYKF